MRCPDCGKFVGLEMQDPEVNSLELSGTTITAEIRIFRNCAECSQELKEGTLSPEVEVDDELREAYKKLNTPKKGERVKVEKRPSFDEWCEGLEVEETTVEQLEEGGGRYAKSYFGATVGYRIYHSDDNKTDVLTGEISDKMAAGEMEELV